MWSIKEFKTRAEMQAWIEKNGHRMRWQEIVVNNGYGVQYRPLVEPRMPR